MEAKEQALQNITSTIEVFNTKDYIEKIKKAMIEGEVNPLSAFVVVKRMSKVGEEILKDKELKKLALEEAEKHLSGTQKTFNLHSANISKGVTYTWYDFSECNHPVLNQLYSIQKEVKERISLIEEELKLLILNEKQQMTLGVGADSKTIKVEKVPFLKWEDNEDEVTVFPPQKIQDVGLRFNKI